MNPLIKRVVKSKAKKLGKTIAVGLVVNKLPPEAKRTVRIVSDFVKSR